MTTVTIVDESHTVAVSEAPTTVEISTGGGSGAAEVAAHLADTVAAHAATAISFAPAGTIAASTVQAAIEEVASEASGGGIAATIVDAKGDLIAATAADTVARLAVGTARQRLIADSAAATGLKWVDQDVFNVKHFGALGDSTTDDKAAIQAAIDACDVNRGGTVYFPQGRYRLATGLIVTYQGTRLLGEGMPGTTRTEAQGSSRIVPDNGIIAITCNSGGAPSHQVLGYGFENLHVVAKSGNTTGSGILVQNAERTLVRNVTCSDFIAGYGLKIDGKSGNSQYAILDNYSGGDCLYGLHLVGTAPNGMVVNGGYFAGQGQTPRVGSVGIYQETGDTLKVFGTVIQGYATGFYCASASGVCADLFGMRLEFCNIGWRIAGDGVRIIGGSLTNSLLTGTGTTSIGVQIESTADKVEIAPSLISVTNSLTSPGTVQAIVDNGGTNLVDRWTTFGGARISPSIVDAKGDLIAATAADTVSRLAVGTNGHVLKANSAQATGLEWAAESSGGIAATIVDAKGDIIAATAADTVSRLGVGANGTALFANSAQATGLEWVDAATQAELDAHTGDSSAAHAATAVSFSPTGTIAATDVQAAIAEVASEAGGGSLTSSSNYLSSDVTMTTSGTFYDGGTLTLAAGTWLLSGAVQILGSTTATREWTAKLWDGTTVVSNAAHRTEGTGQTAKLPIHISAVVSPGSSTTYKISVTSTVNADILLGTGVFCTYLHAVKIA